ncbi:MAG: sigma 54-dependent Fis family transcriptional regulator [Bryobacterales bacterium]|nr:sigma 54-dependent Fis family transcriptional regulator [Bryobacterales bacterium]
MPEPSLVVLSGVFANREFPLAGEEILVGRDGQCQIPVPDGAMSRRHFRIRRDGAKLLLTDLGSHNGTYVNSLAVKEAVLSHQDRIEAGQSIFLVLAGEEPSSTNAARAVRDEPATSTHTVRVAMHRAADRDTPARPARELAALLDIGSAIQDQRAIAPLAERLLAALSAALPVAEAVVVLFRDGLNEEPWTMSKSARGEGEECTYDDALVRSAVTEEAALLNGDVIVAPLAGHEAIVLRGAVHLRAREGARFDENHLRLAAAAGLTAGLALDAANRLELAEAENARLRRQLELQHDMVGESPRMQAVYKFIARVAPAPTTVLITGESGTGKELVAQAIHRNSPRAHRPFVAINCASLGEHLLESELFGHEKGAFTGAVTQKKGKLELAHTGTVFLDELGEMPLLTQAKLLRVLQQRQFERLGGTRVIEVDLRVVAATNRNLMEAVKTGAFRQDLFYRLNVVSIDLPSLRDRREDVPLLAAYFTTRFAQRLGRHVEGLSPEARACLLHYDWPGNVRELENAIERAVVMGSASAIQPEDLPELVVEAGSRAVALGEGGFHAAVVECKRRLVLEALDRVNGSVTEAAKLLGLNANYLHRLMNNLDLRPERG